MEANVGQKCFVATIIYLIIKALFKAIHTTYRIFTKYVLENNISTNFLSIIITVLLTLKRCSIDSFFRIAKMWILLDKSKFHQVYQILSNR